MLSRWYCGQTVRTYDAAASRMSGSAPSGHAVRSALILTSLLLTPWFDSAEADRPSLLTGA